MILIYVAGKFRAQAPYGQPNQWEQNQNIQAAASAALTLWKRRFAVISPHLNTSPFQGACPDEIWLEGDLEFVKRSDAMVLIAGWLSSRGATNEKTFAESQGIPVFEWEPEVGDGYRLDSLAPEARAIGLWLSDWANDRRRKTS